VIVLDGTLFVDGSIDRTTKAAEVKRDLNMGGHLPLMSTLGKMGKVAMVRETETKWELVIPHELLLASALTYSEEPIVRFQRFPTMPVTQKCCILNSGDPENVGEWFVWNEGESDRKLEETVLQSALDQMGEFIAFSVTAVLVP